MKTYLSLLGVAALVLFSPIHPAHSAPTPNGETPAVETICDELKGGTPGLFGLCIAACEAQDLDDLVMTEKGSAKFDKFVNKYNKLKGVDDPDLPCATVQPVDVGECPLVSQEKLDEILSAAKASSGDLQRLTSVFPSGWEVDVLTMTGANNTHFTIAVPLTIETYAYATAQIVWYPSSSTGPSYINTLILTLSSVTAEQLLSCAHLTQAIYDYLSE